ncbi:MAG TPA: GntR family transcriptional regulator [Candidatus Atribacteria bacterium]|nr:GntR family transcriptional regulator [Candidatus Atribacteria bacterium]
MVNMEIYNKLKKRIVYLDYQPKQVLSIKELAKEFGVSPIPIREVLILLENEKLVYIIPNNGIYVTDVSFQELKDVFEVRLFLIGLSGRLAAQRITSEELNKLKELLIKIQQEQNRKELIMLDAEFHDLVNCSTKNQTLVETLKRLRNQIGRLWFFAKENDAYSKKIPDDFKALIMALENRDQVKSEQIMKDHAIHFINQIKMSLYSE